MPGAHQLIQSQPGLPAKPTPFQARFMRAFVIHEGDLAKAAKEAGSRAKSTDALTSVGKDTLANLETRCGFTTLLGVAVPDAEVMVCLGSGLKAMKSDKKTPDWMARARFAELVLKAKGILGGIRTAVQVNIFERALTDPDAIEAEVVDVE